MDGLFDSVSVRIVASLVAACIIVALYYSFDIYQFFARTDFGYLNAYLVQFTRHDKGSKEDRVIFDLIGYKIPLRKICPNRFVFWFIIYRSMKVTLDKPVLNFGSWRNVLALVRGHTSRTWAGMAVKRFAGLTFTEVPSQLALVYDKSDDSTNYVLRIMIISDRDIQNFTEYRKKPPMNTDNFKFVGKIVDAHNNKTGSFINARVTAA